MSDWSHCLAMNAGSKSHFSTGGVDPDGVVQLLLGDATLDGHTVALRHLPGVRTQVVEPDHPLLGTELTVTMAVGTHLSSTIESQ